MANSVIRLIQFQKTPPLEHNWTATVAAICVITFVLSAVSIASLLLGAENEALFIYYQHIKSCLVSINDVLLVQYCSRRFGRGFRMTYTIYSKTLFLSITALLATNGRKATGSKVSYHFLNKNERNSKHLSNGYR